MKKSEIITLAISLVIVVISGILIYYSVLDYRTIVNNPTASGVDFLMVPQIYGIFLILPSIAGLVSSGLCLKFSVHKIVKIISYILIVFFTLCIFASLIMCG